LQQQLGGLLIGAWDRGQEDWEIMVDGTWLWI
jgi:hypothetical protein